MKKLFIALLLLFLIPSFSMAIDCDGDSDDLMDIACGGTDSSAITAGEFSQLEAIGTSTISAGQWVFLGAMDQGTATTDDVVFNSIVASLMNTCHTSEPTADLVVGAWYGVCSTWNPTGADVPTTVPWPHVAEYTDDDPVTWTLIHSPGVVHLSSIEVASITLPPTFISTGRVLTASESRGGWIIVTAEVDVELLDCEAVDVGMNVCVEQGDASEIVSVAFGADSNDEYLLDGTEYGGSTEHELDSPGGALDRGAYVCLHCTEDDLWRIRGSKGIWVDGGEQN